MICLDSNVIIYIANGTLSESIIKDTPIIYPSVIRIETLGYHKILSIEEQRLRELFATLSEVPMTEAIIELAIKLRQQKKIGLGDAIVASTAIDNKSELWTANEKDFTHIEGLNIYNPVG